MDRDFLIEHLVGRYEGRFPPEILEPFVDATADVLAHAQDQPATWVLVWRQTQQWLDALMAEELKVRMDHCEEQHFKRQYRAAKGSPDARQE
jgi:hypothetical protein